MKLADKFNVWLANGLILIVGIVVVNARVANAGLADSPVVFKKGEWSVLRSIDTMTDKVSCTGIYNNTYRIQLTDEELYIQVKGGVKGITLRFGDQPAEKLRLPDSMEKELGVIIIQNNEFNKLLGSNRLRVQAINYIDNLQYFDIDLTNILEVVENIRSVCPSDPNNKTLTEKSNLCEDKVIERLRSKGVSEEVIKFACFPDWQARLLQKF